MKTHRSNRSADQVEAVLIARDYRAKWFSRSFATFMDACNEANSARRPNPMMMRVLHMS